MPIRKNNQKKRDAEGFTVRERLWLHAWAQTVAKDSKGSFADAARMIGVSDKNAAGKGHQYASLPHVQVAMAKIVAEQARKFDIGTEKILQEIAACAFANMKNYLTFGEDGSAKIDWSKMTPEQSAAISEVTIDEYQEKTGTDEFDKPTFETVKRIRFKLHDKKGHLEMLGRYHKLFTDNVAHSNPDGSSIAAQQVIVQFVDAPVRKD